MSSLTINDLDPATADALRVRAGAHGRTVEAEARQILSDAVVARPETGLADAIRRRFAPFGGVDDLAIPLRESAADPPIFDP